MEITQRPIDGIHPYDKNAKRHPQDQVDKVAASIREFGFNQPIVVDKDGVIIVGHGRYLAAQSIGLKEVPVMKLDLNEEQVKAYRLADNRLNESDWDMDLVISELKALTEPMIDLTGFSKDLILENDDKDDEVLPPPVVPKSKLGDVYTFGPHRVLCGDSTKKEDVYKLMDGKMSDMVFTDPPWNVAIGLDSNPKHRQREGLINDDLGVDFPEFLNAMALNIALFNKGDVYCVMGCEEWPSIHRSLTTAGLHWSSTIVWAKDIFVLGRSKYHRQYEPIWYGWKDTSTYKGDRKQSDLWAFARPKRSEEHPTMKPVELVLKAIKNSTVENDIVLDLFLGGGSTLIASEKSKRSCFGMELDPKYVDVIVQRYVNFTGNTEIFKNGIAEFWEPSEAPADTGEGQGINDVT